MIWVLIFGLIALAGLITLISYAVWLWHKASDLFSELEMLGKRLEELGDLLAQLQPTEFSSSAS
ncbi:MAG: hypothetical protein J0I14_03440 [Propionibacteriaceae bacterium]|jgi:hypothetical protein|nr:hypothetical protein [Propionibacteriaceae bacterium]